MTDNTPSPVICVNCKRPFPDGIRAEDGPGYIGRYNLLPRADDIDGFTNEAQSIVRYIRVVSIAARYAPDLEDSDIAELYGLIQDLSEEAGRRLSLASDALAEVWERSRRTA